MGGTQAYVIKSPPTPTHELRWVQGADRLVKILQVLQRYQGWLG